MYFTVLYNYSLVKYLPSGTGSKIWQFCGAIALTHHRVLNPLNHYTPLHAPQSVRFSISCSLLPLHAMLGGFDSSKDQLLTES